MSRLPAQSACVLDDIHNQFLKRGGPAVARSLLVLFRRLFQCGYVPVSWLCGSITPISKRTGAIRCSDFRPICLLSCVCKLFERILAARILFTAESRGWLSDEQFGFRERRSVEDQLLSLLDYAKGAFDRRNVVVCAFLDLEKAYDTVWRDGLLHMLIQLGVRGRMLVWLRAFLRNRSNCVRVNGELSRSTSYDSGLPQGSCLSPVLFCLFLDPLLRLLSGFRGAFADDVMSAVIAADVVRGSQILSRNLRDAWEWARRYRMRWNLSKCVANVLTPLDSPGEPVVRFGGGVLSFERNPRYLGLWLDQKLLFAFHVQKVHAKASRSLGYVRKLAGPAWSVDFKNARSLYVTTVRQPMEFASVIWSGAAQSLLKKLDSVQLRALSGIAGISSMVGTDALEQYCGVQPQALRRMQLQIAFVDRVRRLPAESPTPALLQRASVGRGARFGVYALGRAMAAETRIARQLLLPDVQHERYPGVNAATRAPWIDPPPALADCDWPVLSDNDARRAYATYIIRRVMLNASASDIQVFCDGSVVGERFVGAAADVYYGHDVM